MERERRGGKRTEKREERLKGEGEIGLYKRYTLTCIYIYMAGYKCGEWNVREG